MLKPLFAKGFRSCHFCASNFEIKGSLMAFKKTFKASTEDLNDRGFWVRTAGIRLDAARKNCPAYFQHYTWDVPLGHWENLRVNENGELLADLVIEGGNDIEKEYIRKIENGDIKAASVGLDIISWNEDALNLKPGQTRPTLWDTELFEISLAPLPGNKNALALKTNGNIVNLSTTESETFLPHLKTQTDMKSIALKLGLLETATENDILTAIAQLKAKADRADTAHAALVKLHAEGLSAEDKEVYETLAGIDFEKAVKFAGAHKMKDDEPGEAPAPATFKKETTIASLIKKSGDSAKDESKECFDYLQKHNPAELARIRKEDNAKYEQLAKDYGNGKRYAGK